MSKVRSASFLLGTFAGTLMTISTGILIGPALAGDQDPGPAPQRYFVTGDTNNATLWRLEDDGALICVSRNQCRVPGVRRDH